MADMNKRGPADCGDGEGERGERGKRGKRGKRGHRGHDGARGERGERGEDGAAGATGPTGPAALFLDPTPPTFTGNGSQEAPLQVINVAPQPFVTPPEIRTIYVRATGSDETGDGTTPATAFRTIQRATLEVPRFIPEGVYYVIDATNLIEGGAEVIPPHYAFPVWKAAWAVGFSDLFPFPEPLAAVTLRADFRDVPSLGADAIIEEGDLETTEVGGGIVSTTAGPITVETAVPHGLVQSPFGIEGVFEGLVQVVEISGAVDPAANGVFLALVTKPTNAESTTFELFDFDLNPVVGVGGGAGGTVTVFFVQDQFSGQTQIKVSTPRASWLPNGSLRGKMLVDGSGDHGVIYDNTDDTLFVTHNRGSVSFDAGPVRIQEQSCAIQCSDSFIFGFTGGFNLANQDSLALNNIEIRAATDGSSLFQHSGFVFIESCRLENPFFHSPVARAFTGNSYLINPVYDTTAVYQNRCLVENHAGFTANWWAAFQGTVFIQDIPLGTGGDSRDDGVISFFGVKVISTADPVLHFPNSGDTFLTAVSIDGGSGDAVRVEAQARTRLLSVGGSGWPGAALVVDNGAQVEVDRFTFSEDDVMVVGLPLNPGVTGLPPRTFGNFRSGADGGFVRQQLDVQGLHPDPTTFGAAGTVSRVFQREP